MTRYKDKAAQPEARVVAAMLARQNTGHDVGENLSNYRDQNVANHTRNP